MYIHTSMFCNMLKMGLWSCTNIINTLTRTFACIHRTTHVCTHVRPYVHDQTSLYVQLILPTWLRNRKFCWNSLRPLPAAAEWTLTFSKIVASTMQGQPRTLIQVLNVVCVCGCVVFWAGPKTYKKHCCISPAPYLVVLVQAVACMHTYVRARIYPCRQMYARVYSNSASNFTVSKALDKSEPLTHNGNPTAHLSSKVWFVAHSSAGTTTV